MKINFIKIEDLLKNENNKYLCENEEALFILAQAMQESGVEINRKPQYISKYSIYGYEKYGYGKRKNILIDYADTSKPNYGYKNKITFYFIKANGEVQEHEPVFNDEIEYVEISDVYKYKKEKISGHNKRLVEKILTNTQIDEDISCIKKVFEYSPSPVDYQIKYIKIIGKEIENIIEDIPYENIHKTFMGILIKKFGFTKDKSYAEKYGEFLNHTGLYYEQEDIYAIITTGNYNTDYEEEYIELSFYRGYQSHLGTGNTDRSTFSICIYEK